MKRHAYLAVVGLGMIVLMTGCADTSRHYAVLSTRQVDSDRLGQCIKSDARISVSRLGMMTMSDSLVKEVMAKCPPDTVALVDVDVEHEISWFFMLYVLVPSFRETITATPVIDPKLVQEPGLLVRTNGGPRP